MSRAARFTIDVDQVPGFTCAYLRTAGDEVAFIETNTAHAVPKLLAALAEQGKTPEQVRWIVVTHAHLDHAGGAGVLLAKCPNATLLAHPRAAKHLIDPSRLIASATQVYGKERFAQMYGAIEPIPESRVKALDDGATFDLGGAPLRVLHTAGHARHHFVVWDAALGSVYTGDAFGLVYPSLQRGARFALASTSPTDFDPPEARRAIDRILGLGAEAACLTHFGEVRDLDDVASQILAWIDRSEDWLDEATLSDAPVPELTARIAELLRGAIARDASQRGLDLTSADWATLALDVDLNAQGIAFVAAKKRPR